MSTKAKVILGVVLAVIVLTIVLIAISLGKLNSDEVGLIYDPVSKHLLRDPKYEGLHNGPPGFQFIKFPSVFETITYSSLQCLNKDGVEISLSISFQYRVRPNQLNNIIKQFRDHGTFVTLLTVIGQSSIHDSCCKFNTSQFQAERGAFQEEVLNSLIRKYDEISTDVTDLQVNDIKRPSRYENAVKEKETAREDISVARNERPRILTEAETELKEAETQANIDRDKAYSNARNTLARARAESEAILNEYIKEAESYHLLKDDLGLSPEGMLAYLGVRVVSESKNEVQVSLKGPARTSWLGEV